jgi:two-component system chemotaxis response regulator CheB
MDSTSDGFDVVAIAASAGGIHALGVVLASLPADFRVPVLVVEHLDRRHKTVIAEVLGRHSAIKLKLADDREGAVPGVAYIAPPDRHLLIGRGAVLHLSDSELVHFVRPSADLLFESVAGEYGERAIAVVLTGTGIDGSMGVEAVKARGGTVIAEDPETAQFGGMPRAAIATNAVDFVLPLEEIGPVVVRLVDAGAAGDGR